MEPPMLPVNIFQKIIQREIPANIIHEDELSLAFHDVNPQAPVHVLIIPKKVIRTHDDITLDDQSVLGHLHLVAQQIARKLHLDDRYRLVLNCKEGAGQTVPHLHMHLLAGRDLAWPPG
jgi:histidine triad (HIT) family protein